MEHRWITLPICSECGHIMTENDANDYECTNCEEILYEYEIDEN